MDFISFPADTFLKILIYIVIDGNVFEFFDIWRHWCINIFTATDNFFVFFTTWNKTLAFACSLCIIFIFIITIIILLFVCLSIVSSCIFKILQSCIYSIYTRTHTIFVTTFYYNCYQYVLLCII